MAPAVALRVAGILIASFQDFAQPPAGLELALREIAAQREAFAAASPDAQPEVAEEWLRSLEAAASLAASGPCSQGDLQRLGSNAASLLFEADAAISSEELFDRMAEAMVPVLPDLSDPHAVYIESELAALAVELGDVERIDAILGPALRRFPEDPTLLALAAESAMQIGDWSAAAARLTEAESIFGRRRADPDDWELVAMLENVRTLFEIRLGRADRAFEHASRMYQLEREQPTSIAVVYLADIAILSDRPDDLLELFAREEARIPARARRRVEAQVVLARTAHVGAEDAAAALDELEEVAAEVELDPYVRIVAWLHAAELATDCSDFVRARAGLAEAQTLLDVAPAATETVAYRRQQALARALAGRVARQSGIIGPPLLETARAATLAAFADLLAEWRSTPLLAGGISFLRSDARRTVVYEAIQAELDRGDEVAAFARLVEAEALGTLARGLEVDAPDLASVQQALCAGSEWLLVYLPAKGGTHLFVVSAETLTYHPLADEGTIRRALVAFNKALDHGPDDAITATVAHLSELLLPSTLREALGDARAVHMVRIVGADLLEDLPFEALPLGRSVAGPPLGLALPVSYLPSIPFGVHLRRRALSREAPVLDVALVIGPRESDSGARFDLDADALIAPFPAGRARIVELAADAVGDDELAFPAAAELCIVAHGVEDRGRDPFIGLLLSRGSDGKPGMAWADALARAKLPRLVVLATCYASSGAVRDGEDGASHLGGAALAGGATSVLLGRGALDAAVVVPLLERFHAELQAGAPTAEALRRAHARFPRMVTAPPFKCFGLGDDRTMRALDDVRPIAPSSRTTSPSANGAWLLACGVMLACAGGFLVSRRSRRRS